MLWISQIEPNDIGIKFRPLARPELFGNARSASSFFALLMNCMFLCLSALMRWKIQWATLRLCSIVIIRSLSRVIVSDLPVVIFESLVIFFGSPECSDANSRMFNVMLGTIV
jgi:hypothetical protein